MKRPAKSQGIRYRHAIVASLALALAIIVYGRVAAAGESTVKAYSFAASPLAIYDRLPELELGEAPKLSAEERALLARLWKLQAKKESAYSGLKVGEFELLEAMLLASDVESPAARKKFHEQFQKLTVEARVALKGADTDCERGERLMKFLHAGIMSKGYEADQSSLAEVFSSHQYNCVSSSAMYYLAGTRLGLNLRPLAIPGGFLTSGHAALDLLEGDKRIQVEPTNSDGFDWEAKLNRPGVFTIGLQPDRKDGYEIDPLGLAAMIYSNRGVALGKADPPRKLAAARCYLAALALDPLHHSATNNLRSLLVNWGPDLAAAKKFEEATRALKFGISIAPDVGDLQDNNVYVWSKYVMSLLADGQDTEAIAVMRRAAEAVPDRKEYQTASYWFCRFGDTIVEDVGWDEALAVAERARRALPPDQAKEVITWRANVYRRWSQWLLRMEDVDGSLKVLAQGFVIDPESAELREGLAHHANEAMYLLEEKKDLSAVIECYQSLRKQFPQVEQLTAVGHHRATRSCDKLLDEKNFERALAAIGLYSQLLTTDEQKAELGSYIYDRWARDLSGQKKWKECLDKYVDGLKAYPDNARLANNSIVAVDDWASAAMDAKDWNEAIRIYKVGLEYFPKDGHLEHNLAYCQEMKERK